MEMGWTGGHQEQHVKQKFGVTATAYPKCQHLRVALRQPKPCSRERGRGWERGWKLAGGSQQLPCVRRGGGEESRRGVEWG